MNNKFVEYAEARKQETFAVLNSNRPMSRDKGQIADLLNKKVTIGEVEVHKSKTTGEDFVVFTVQEDINHFFFAPAYFKKDVLFAKEKGFNLDDLAGSQILFTKEENPADKEIFTYKYKIID